MSKSSPAGEAGALGDVDQSAADLRPAAHHGGDLVDIVGTARSGIDISGHAVLQRQRRQILTAAGVGMDVDQPGRHDLAARIDRLGGITGDAGLDRRDPACSNRHVADAVEPDRGVDDAPALDDEIVGRGPRFRHADGDRSACADRDHLTPVHHRVASTTLIISNDCGPASTGVSTRLSMRRMERGRVARRVNRSDAIVDRI